MEQIGGHPRLKLIHPGLPVQGRDVLQQEAQIEAHVRAREQVRGAALVQVDHRERYVEACLICDHPECERRYLMYTSGVPLQGGDVLQQEIQVEAHVSLTRAGARRCGRN
jgi:hypothetical protein